MNNRIDKESLITAIQGCTELSERQKEDIQELLAETKKYGLVWENTPEDAYEELRSEIPVMHEDDSKAILNGDEYPDHAIIEGDNLHALTNLCYTHQGKIDVIYIDPPYNTGNKDFEYNDSFIDSEDSFKHSKWLSFMSNRLKFSKQLLSENGTIFISIDDNEEADLKLLCDEIYGAQNFVANISWQRTYSIRNDSKGIPTEVEHILVYSQMPNWQPKKLRRTEKMDSLYKNPDNDDMPWTSSSCTAPGASTHQGMVYAIQHPFSGEMMYPSVGRCWTLGQKQMLENMLNWGNYELKDLHDDEERAKVCGLSPSDVRKDVQAIVLKDSLEEAKRKAKKILEAGHWPIFYFTNNGKGGLRRKTYLKDVGGRLPTNFFQYAETGHTDEAKKEMISIFGGKSPFATPKPTRLIKRILEIASEKESIVLDFFAGSGTTMQATMELNKEDGGHRQCILVTNNENNICEEVTYVRNKKVIEGYDTSKGEHVEGLNDNNLRYFKIDEDSDKVPRDGSRNSRIRLAAGMVDMLRLKHDVYTEQDSLGNMTVDKNIMRYYEDNGHGLLILMDADKVGEIVDAISKINLVTKMEVYVYSEGSYAFDDDFLNVKDKINLYALPGPFLQTFHRIAPAMNEVEIDNHGHELTEEEANETSDDFKDEEE